MTDAQRTELDKAIERAKSNHTRVIAQGHFKDFSCDRFFLVSSSSSGARPHIVRLSGHHLICDCAARVICTHRAAAHLHLIDEAVRKQLASAAVESALAAEEAAGVAASTATTPDSSTAQAAHTTARAFDIWKH